MLISASALRIRIVAAGLVPMRRSIPIEPYGKLYKDYNRGYNGFLMGDRSCHAPHKPPAMVLLMGINDHGSSCISGDTFPKSEKLLARRESSWTFQNVLCIVHKDSRTQFQVMCVP